MMLKSGVEVYGIRPELVVAIMVAKDVVNEEGFDFVITSCTERGVQHSATSLHWSGCAFDMRTRDMPASIIADTIRERLGKEFDVIREDTHIHIEFQPEVSSGPEVSG